MNKSITERIKKLEIDQLRSNPHNMTLDEYYSAPPHIQDEIFGDWYDDMDNGGIDSKIVVEWLKEFRS